MLTSLRPRCKPNDGFIKQLKLFEQMNCKLDTSNVYYKWFKLIHGSPINCDSPPSGVRGKIKCCKCRCVVAFEDQVLPHLPGRSPDWSGQEEVISDSKAHCRQGLFIVDASKMLEINQLYDNSKYNCLKCGSKLGNFGHSSCGCGAIMKKGIWLNFTKVDRRISFQL